MATSAPPDPIPANAFPTFVGINGIAPVMPAAWTATVLLHPFGPPPSSGPIPDGPFFQLSTAVIDYAAGGYFSARITGCDHGRWWYLITPAGTRVSVDAGKTWSDIDIGWSLPFDWFGAQAAAAQCVGSSPLNWMLSKLLDWWKVPVPLGANSPPAVTWMWFGAEHGDPVRMMFGNGPPGPAMGDPTQLAFFQMFSFIYFAAFQGFDAANAPGLPEAWAEAAIPGFQVGNPCGYKPFVWNSNFGTTAFSTPVNGNFNPLPSRTLYAWKPDSDYKVYTDRAQATLMHYTYNTAQPAGSKPISTVLSLLTGRSAIAPRVPNSGAGFLYTVYEDGASDCKSGSDFPFGQEPPTWVSIPGVQGTIRATISDNPALCPGEVVTVYSVLFPPSPPNYPDGTYLWAWYSPFKGSDGTQSRPVTFMQSQSGVNLGTSLALDDYFFYQVFDAPINPANFEVPTVCGT